MDFQGARNLTPRDRALQTVADAKTASIEKSFSLRVTQMKRNSRWKPQEPVSCAYKPYYTNTLLKRMDGFVPRKWHFYWIVRLEELQTLTPAVVRQWTKTYRTLMPLDGTPRIKGFPRTDMLMPVPL